MFHGQLEYYIYRLVDSEFGHMEAYELLYKQFVTIYGPNTSEECKDCSYQEDMKVYHPY